MPDTNDTPPQTGETIKTIAELVLKDEAFRHSVGRRATYAILLTLAIATVKLTIGIRFSRWDMLRWSASSCSS